MTQAVAKISSAFRPSPPKRSLAGMACLDVRFVDTAVALATFAASVIVLWLGLAGVFSFPLVLFLHLGVLIIPADFLFHRLRAGGELTVPILLMVATAVSGPIGAGGCTLLALTLWLRHPSPERLDDWYDYIAGIVARPRAVRIHEELSSNRLPIDPAAKVPRFTPILTGSSIEDQQRVLGVVGRHYDADFRPVLKRALRSRNGLIRAQAAAIASGLDLEEKTRLWSATPLPESKTSAIAAGPAETDSAQGRASR
jgi:hypothetical protein